MPNLNELFVLRQADLLQNTYRDPSITAYNRLEPRPRSEDFSRSLRAEIRDPLWMLTRQWQMGEFQGEDAGSAIDARVMTRRRAVDRVALGTGPGRAYDDRLPFETMIERERVPWTHALRLQTGQYFLKLHTAPLLSKYLPKYRQAFSFPQGGEEALRGQPEAVGLYLGSQRSGIDGEKLHEAIIAGSFATAVGVDAGDTAALTSFADQLLAWLARRYVQPTPGDSAWQPEQLTYQASAGAVGADGSQLVLRADHYHHGRLDWYAFDLDPGAPPLGAGAPASTTASPPAFEEVMSFLPAPAAFKGMPSPRFWEMEDRQINFGSLNARTTDHLLLAFAELGLVYGNDWFVFPYPLPVNTVCETVGLVITDVFGQRTLVRAADEGPENEWQRWSMFHLSTRDGTSVHPRRMFLPAALSATLESAPIEEVHFIRDEMANMVWAIESVIPDATGRGLNGDDAADKTGVQPPDVSGSPASIRYLLGTTVPENWIPFLPVQRPGSHQDIALQRAAMPKLGIPPRDVVKPKGVLLTEVEVTDPWRINEEEIPYAGTIVKRTYQRARWYDGRTYVWIGRARETGRGQGRSDLRFDQVEPVTKTA
jgi:hypothetical protein